MNLKALNFKTFDEKRFCETSVFDWKHMAASNMHFTIEI